MASSIYPSMKLYVDQEWQRLKREQLDPWYFLTAGPQFSCKDFYGRSISYQGVVFEGSPQNVFWGEYIEPFLRDFIERSVSNTRKLCMEKEVDLVQPAKETRAILGQVISFAYHHMLAIECSLLRSQKPKRGNSSRLIEDKITVMTEFLDNRVKAELDSWKPKSKFTDHFQRYPYIYWLVTTCIAITILGINIYKEFK